MFYKKIPTSISHLKANKKVTPKNLQLRSMNNWMYLA